MLVLPDSIECPRFFSHLGGSVANRCGLLPHWEQPGKTVFVTFRLADSLPADKLARWREAEDDWRRSHPMPWSMDVRLEYDRLFGLRFEQLLDQGFGSCLLGDPLARDVVESALRFFDGIRYRLYAFVVKPNHVHVCFMPLPLQSRANGAQREAIRSADRCAASGLRLPAATIEAPCEVQGLDDSLLRQDAATPAPTPAPTPTSTPISPPAVAPSVFDPSATSSASYLEVWRVVHSWKSFTAHRLNALLGRKGALWQREYFDRYIRDWNHFERVVRYIVKNDPKRAWTVFQG